VIVRLAGHIKGSQKHSLCYLPTAAIKGQANKKERCDLKLVHFSIWLKLGNSTLFTTAGDVSFEPHLAARKSTFSCQNLTRVGGPAVGRWPPAAITTAPLTVSSRTPISFQRRRKHLSGEFKASLMS
jgi:hypothetical protein